MILSSKHFFMIRHGETIANVEGWVAGSIDTSLTDKGRNETISVSRYLEALPNKPKSFVYTNLSRSKDTATILNKVLKLPMFECAAVAERCFGNWQRLPLETMRERRDKGMEPPNGETVAEFTRRVTKGLEEVLELAESPLIVTHGAVFGALFGAFGCESEVVRNCHLYEFVPIMDTAPFPWKVLSYDASEEGAIIQTSVEITKILSRPIGHNPKIYPKKERMFVATI